MMKRHTENFIAGIIIGVYAALIVAAATGYVMNIVTLFTTADTTGEIVTRAAGIFIPFVGAVVGWF